jgi:hypothetical protein
MITEIANTKGTPAITSDHWHVVHSRWTDNAGARPFVRSVHSEHDDQRACREAARELRRKVDRDLVGVPVAEHDEVFVRRPNFKSLLRAKSRVKEE